MPRSGHKRLHKSPNRRIRLQDKKDLYDTNSILLPISVRRELTYAHNCPVKVKGVRENDPNKEIHGRILCPSLRSNSCGDAELLYSVMLYLDENNVRVKLRVKPELITFRKDVVTKRR